MKVQAPLLFPSNRLRRSPFADLTNTGNKTLLVNQFFPRKFPGCSRTLKESPTKDLDDLMSGDIREYTIGQVLGAGAYATVRKSTHKQSNRPRAIKSYEKIQLTDLGKRKTLRNEIETLKLLSHPNIVQYFGAAKSTRHIHLITEYIEGESLDCFLRKKRSRKLPENEAKTVFRQIVEAVAYCHSKLVVHRDIKLENILIDSAFNVKAIDFGFASRMPKGSKTRRFCGTPSYMAPEIVEKREHTGQPVDIWALGVVLYVLVSGQYPFDVPTERELYRKISLGLKYIPESVPRQCKELIKEMMRLDPERRPKASEVLNHSWLRPC